MNNVLPDEDIRQHLTPLQEYAPRQRPTMAMREAAVLIPVLPEGRLIYTLRSRNLTNHAGQISFPGGRIEPEEDAWSAALREAEEEIGLAPSAVEPLGRIDDVYSPRGFHIQCFVGLCRPFAPRLNPHEVDQLIHADLDELFDESLHETKPWKTRLVHYFNFREGQVWGVTGYITYRLREILKQQRARLSEVAGSAGA
jgi:8-oxo-dGTP pyrophosphatase MutT (NUDIX family)